MIDLDDDECVDLIRELRRVVLPLTLVSHVSAMTLERATPSSDEDIGGKRPSGGIDHMGDREFTYRQKSAEYFQRRLVRMVDAHPTYDANDLRALISEAEDVVEAWTKTPLLSGQRPVMADPQWKAWVATCGHSTSDLVRWYGCTRQYIHQVRQAYGGERIA